jgi:hypothetical protein
LFKEKRLSPPTLTSLVGEAKEFPGGIISLFDDTGRTRLRADAMQKMVQRAVKG